MAVVDNFNAADGAFSAPWVNMFTGGAFSRFEGIAYSPTGPALFRYGGLGFTDYHVKIKMTTTGTGGILLRAAGTAGGSNDTGIFCYWNTANALIYKRTPGANTDLSSGGVSLALATNDLLEFRVVGSTYTVYKNGSTIGLSISDSTYATGDPGLYNGGYQCDDFDVTDMGGAGAGVFGPLLGGQQFNLVR